MSLLKQVVNQIRPYMQEHGYQFSRNCFYSIYDNIAYCIGLDMPGGLLYATFYVMPLYIPCENRYYSYGNRLHVLPFSHLAPLHEGTDVLSWCEDFYKELEKVVFPFFSQIASPSQLTNLIEKKLYSLMPYFSCPEVQIYRLQMFNYLYCCNFVMLDRLIPKYRLSVQNSTFFSHGVRSRYLQEMEKAEELVSSGMSECRKYCMNRITETLQECFPEYLNCEK